MSDLGALLESWARSRCQEFTDAGTSVTVKPAPGFPIPPQRQGVIVTLVNAQHGRVGLTWLGGTTVRMTRSSKVDDSEPVSGDAGKRVAERVEFQDIITKDALRACLDEVELWVLSVWATPTVDIDGA